MRMTFWLERLGLEPAGPDVAGRVEV
jgi:hypothetical protein